MTRSRPMDLYTLQTAGDGRYIVTKWDRLGFEVLSQYDLHLLSGTLTCTCPQSAKPTCRHRRMFPALRERVDTDWFYCFDTGEWTDPTQAEAKRASSGEAVDEEVEIEPTQRSELTIASYKEVAPEDVATEFAALLEKPKPTLTGEPPLRRRL